MQEEVESKAVALAISTTKLTGRVFTDVIGKYLTYVKNKQIQKNGLIPRGKQSVRQLIGQNQGVTSIESNDPNIKAFDKVARKYGVDYAVKKIKTEDRHKYVIFFKARDSDALTQAFTEYTRKSLEKGKKASVLKKLNQLIETVHGKAIERSKEKHRGVEL